MQILHPDLLFAILSPFFSSVAAVFKAGAVRDLSVFIVLSTGSLLAGILLLVLSRVFKQKLDWQKIKHFQKEMLLVFLLRYLIGELLYTFGLAQTTAVKAIFFTKVEPYFVLLFSWLFLREKIKKNEILLLIIHIIGALLLSTGGELENIGTSQIGDLLILFAVALFAFSYLSAKKLANNIGSFVTNGVSSLGAGIFFLPFAFLFLPDPAQMHLTQGTLFLILNVLFFDIIALTMWYSSLKSVKGWIVSALRFLGPLLGLPVAYLLMKNTLTPIQFFGAAIILLTSFFIVRGHVKSEAFHAKNTV